MGNYVHDVVRSLLRKLYFWIFGEIYIHLCRVQSFFFIVLIIFRLFMI